MPRIDKYYGTNIIGIPYEALLKLRSNYGCREHISQFRIVCKAKSLAEANRKAEALGLYKNTFHRDWTCETGNDIEMEMADKYEFIICTQGTYGDSFIDIKEIL